MKKTFISAIIMLILVISLAACSSSVPNANKMKTDVEEHVLNFFSESETVDKVEIVKRNTEKDKKQDIAWCKLETHDDEAEYVKYYTLYYKLYDKGGWILEDLERDRKDEWSAAPLAGIKDAAVKESLYGKRILVKRDNWEIYPQNIKNFTIDNHDTDLKAKTDVVTVGLTIEGQVEEVTGKLTVNYIFDDGWRISDISGGESFKAAIKSSAALNITDKELISEFTKKEMYYGGSRAGMFVTNFREQTITMKESEISDFVIKSQESLYLGTQQTINCSFTLTKPRAVFSVDASIQYNYDSAKGWVMQEITFEPKAVSVDIIGNWDGTYKDFSAIGTVSLNIIDIDDKGTVTAVYTYLPSTIDTFSQGGSYNVSGKLDMTTLYMDLVAGDWIDEPYRHSSFIKSDVTAVLLVEDSTIRGRGHDGKYFTVNQ